VLGVAGSALASVVAVLNIREKLRPKPHPLAATLAEGLADIAAAIRDGPP
jgi:hypothetical protein